VQRANKLTPGAKKGPAGCNKTRQQCTCSKQAGLDFKNSFGQENCKMLTFFGFFGFCSAFIVRLWAFFWHFENAFLISFSFEPRASYKKSFARPAH